MALTYVKPDEAHKTQALDFLHSFLSAGENTVNGSAGLDFYKDYDVWLYHLRRVESGAEEGLVPSVVWFALDEAGALVGVLDIRPALPKSKYQWGHVGYSVAPQYRRQGYAGQMLCWGIEQLRAAGARDILAACYADNRASRKVLKKNGFYETGSYTEPETGRMIINYTNVLEEKGNG